MAELKVEIGADIKELIRKLDLAEKELKGLDKTATTTQKKVSNFGKTSATGINKLNKATANANPTLQEFSRVIQDAPYGIQGVGNNITQLVSQFGYLQKSTGGTKNALKALAGSFLGPGGVLFLISMAVSLLTVYGDELFKTKKKTEDFGDASRDAAASVQGEIAVMKSLVNVAQNENETREKRLQAVEQLNKKYPELNNNIKLETINTDKTRDAIDRTTKALEQRAKVRAAEELIAKEAKNLFDAQIAAEEKYLSRRKLIATGIKNSTGVDLDDLDAATPEQLQRVRQLYGKSLGEAKEDRRKAIQEAQSDLTAYTSKLQEIVNNAPNLTDLFGGSGGSGKGKDPKKEAAKYKEFLKSLDADLKLLDAEDEAQNAREIEGIYRQSGAALAADAKEREGLISLTKSVQEVEDFQEKLNEVRKILNDDQFNFDSVLSNDQVDAFIDRLERAKQGATLFGDAVGNSIGQIGNQIAGELETGNAVIDAFVGTLVNGIAQIAASALQGLIVNKALSKITQGVEFAKSSANGITIATSAAAALGPGGIVALPGLLAGVQATIAGAFAGINSFALGSGGFSGDKNLAMVNRNEMILRPMEQSALYGAIRGHRLGSINQSVQSSGMSSPQVEFRLEGTDIVGSVKNTMRRNTRTGGSLTL